MADTTRWRSHNPDLVRDNRLMHERIAEQDRELEQLRSVALAARALVQSAHACLASDDIEHDETSVSEPALTRLEKALADAGLDLTEEEAADG